MQDEKEEVKVKWEKVIKESFVPYINFIDLGNYTMFRIISFKSIVPRLGFYVGIERLGNFYFAINKPFAWQYVQGKLGLQDPDAQAIADWMNAQLDFDFPQQGHYRRHIIEEVEVYGLGAEMKVMPWKPEIIE